MASCDEHNTEEHLNGITHKNVAKKSTTPSIGVAKKSTANPNIARKSTTKQIKPVMKVNGVHPESPNGIAKKRVRVEDEIENPAKVARTQIEDLERKQETMLATVMSSSRSESSPVHKAVSNGEVINGQSEAETKAPTEHVTSQEEGEMSDAAVDALLGDSVAGEDSLDSTIDSSILDDCPADKSKGLSRTGDNVEKPKDPCDTQDSELEAPMSSLVPAYDTLNASYEAESSPDVTMEAVPSEERKAVGSSSPSTDSKESGIISQETSVVNCESNSPEESKAAETDDTIISSNKDSEIQDSECQSDVQTDVHSIACTPTNVESPTTLKEENQIEKLNCAELNATSIDVDEDNELKNDTVPQNSSVSAEKEADSSPVIDDQVNGNVTENLDKVDQPEEFSIDNHSKDENLKEEDIKEPGGDGDLKVLDVNQPDEEGKADVKESEVSNASSDSAAEVKVDDASEGTKKDGDAEEGESGKVVPEGESVKEDGVVAMEINDEPLVLLTESRPMSAGVTVNVKKPEPAKPQHSKPNGVIPSEILIIDEDQESSNAGHTKSLSAKSVSSKRPKEQEEGEVPISSLVMRKNRLDQVIGRLGTPAANGAEADNGVITMRSQDLERYIARTMQNHFHKNHNRVVAGLQKQIAVLNQANDMLQEKASRLQHRLNEMAHARATEKSTDTSNKGVQVTENKIQAGIKRMARPTMGPLHVAASDVKTPAAAPSTPKSTTPQSKASAPSPTVLGTLVSPPASSGMPLAGGTITLMPSVLPPASANISASQIRFSTHETPAATSSSAVTAVGGKRIIDLTDEPPRRKTPQTKTQQPAILMSTTGTPLLLQPVVSPNTISGTILVPQASVQSVVPSTPTATTTSGSRPPPLTPAPNVAQTVAKKTASTDNASQHPAPFPAMPAHRTGPSWKNVPPRPGLKISRVEQGIVLSWNMGLSNDVAEIVNYQLFAYQETNAPALSSLWKKVGDVKALPLPMACTLTQFQEGNKYHFSVRAVDKHGRPGPFSDANTIRL